MIILLCALDTTAETISTIGVAVTGVGPAAACVMRGGCGNPTFSILTELFALSGKSELWS